MMELALMIGGSLLAASGLWGFRSARAMLRRALKTTGRVVELEKSSDEDGEMYFPVIVFTAADGREIRFRGSGTNRPPKVGAKAKVTYDHLYPASAWERGSGVMWAMPFLSGLIGLALLAWGAAEYWEWT